MRNPNIYRTPGGGDAVIFERIDNGLLVSRLQGSSTKADRFARKDDIRDFADWLLTFDSEPQPTDAVDIRFDTAVELSSDKPRSGHAAFSVVTDAERDELRSMTFAQTGKGVEDIAAIAYEGIGGIADGLMSEDEDVATTAIEAATARLESITPNILSLQNTLAQGELYDNPLEAHPSLQLPDNAYPFLTFNHTRQSVMYVRANLAIGDKIPLTIPGHQAHSLGAFITENLTALPDTSKVWG